MAHRILVSLALVLAACGHADDSTNIESHDRTGAQDERAAVDAAGEQSDIHNALEDAPSGWCHLCDHLCRNAEPDAPVCFWQPSMDTGEWRAKCMGLDELTTAAVDCRDRSN